MTPQELKNSILQLAIQGKLVEQRAEEGTGAELLEKIFAAKNAEDAKGKGEKSHAKSAKSAKVGSCVSREEIPDDEKPFDIPESWEWVRLGEVVFNHGQKKPTEDFSYVDIGSIDNKHQRLSDAENIVKPEKASPRARKIIQRGDILYSTVRPYLHNICIVDREFSREPIASTGFAVMACSDCLDNKFLFYFLLSPDFDRYANSTENAKGVAYPAISDKRLYNALFPLPPLAEQKRIVAKIEELMPLVDRYEKAWSRLEDFNKRFPVDMQKSLLQMAIQGKLVEQKADEGTGAELLEKILAAKNAEGARGKGEKSHAKSAKSAKVGSRVSREEIPDDEKPFDIPESWEWARLGVVVDVRDGTHDTPKYVQAGVPLVTSKNLVSGTIDFTNAKFISYEDSKAINIRSGVDDGDVLFAMIGTIGNPVLIRKDREFSIKNMALFKPIDRGLFCMEYLMMFLTKAQFDMRKSASASVQSFVSLSFLRNYPIPLPPLAEQKRIVAKLEELLPLCERLK